MIARMQINDNKINDKRCNNSDFLSGFNGVNKKWRVVTLLKDCNYVKGL